MEAKHASVTSTFIGNSFQYGVLAVDINLGECFVILPDGLCPLRKILVGIIQEMGHSCYELHVDLEPEAFEPYS